MAVSLQKVVQKMWWKLSWTQGNPLKAYGWRYAQVVLDNGVTFRERFLAGWSVQHVNNELVLTKGARRVPENHKVRAVTLTPVLEQMVSSETEFFEELIPGVHGLKCESRAYLDVGLYLPMEGMQYRTTLVCVDRVHGIWELWEMCQSIAALDVLDEEFPDGVERTVLTIASREVLSPAQLGIVVHEGSADAVAPAAKPDAQVDDDPMPGTPELDALFASDDEKACEYLNIGVRMKQDKAQAEAWCEFCTMHKARSDKAVAAPEPKRSVSLLSFDFGFTGRELDPENKLITLCIKDRDTGWRESIPTKRKGGLESTRFLTGEVVRLCNVLGYNDVTIRSDPEPSCLSLQQEIQKARGRLGQRTRLEQAGEEEKASNGAAEEAVASTRQQACVLLSAYEHHTGKQVSSQHPLHAWAMRHGSWILNRYCVSRDQQTPFECTFQSPYTGKIVEFGECVMAMCRTAMANKPVKGSAKWVKSLWLGKANANDGHLVVTAGGRLLITRSIRRTPQRWDASLHDVIKDFPWDHPGFVAGGLGKMRKQREPKPVETVAVPEADEVGVLGPVSPLLTAGDEAASDPTSPEELPSLPVSPSVESSSSSTDDGGSVAGTDQAVGAQPDAMQGVEDEPGILASNLEPEMPSAGGAGGDGDDPDSVQERPAKSARLQAVIQTELYHNDAQVEFDFENAELDELEGYDYGLDDYYFSEEPDLAKGPPDELWRPFGPTEPMLSADEMFAIDSAADDFEIRRLLSMNVLEPLTEAAATQAQHEGSRLLSTKFVRSWRIKMRKFPDGREEQQYLRRSRFVGREYAWLDKERAELFAPASSSLLTRLLPSVFMRCKAEGHVCCVLDVADAFLTVDQRIPTVVHARLGDQQEHVQHFRLVKLLPGQRDGTVRWHEKYKCTVSWLCAHGDEADVIEGQFGIRWLAQHMSRPTTGALRVLRHMILYLKGTSSYGIGFPVPVRGVGVTVQSRTCDQVFIRNAAEFVLRDKVESHLLLDSAALLHKVGVRDAQDDFALVGSEEFQNLLDGNTVRKLVRLVKQQGNVGNSVGLQVAMIVLSHALSQHAVAAAAVLEFIMMLAAFAGEYAQLYPVASTAFVQGSMWMILICLGWCMCRRRSVELAISRDASGGEGSPASPRGAKSKRMTKPPRREEDEGVTSDKPEEASSSNGPAGRVSFNVPLTPGASVKLEVSSGDGSKNPSSVSAESASEHEFPRARREPIKPKELGTTPIEHYVRRLVTYLARIQSVMQNTDYGLALKVYVKLGTTDWLKMYSRLYHGCDLHPCENLPTPAMLTVAALVNTEEDLIDPDAEREIIVPSDRERHEAEVAHHRQQAIEAAKEMRSKLSVGGSPDATTIRSQPTILCTDFELYAKNGATHFPLQNEMMSKGWGQFVRFSPTISTVVNFSETQKENMERILKDVYIKHFDKILSLVPRQNFAGYDAVGAYLSLQLRFLGCIVVHGFAVYEKQIFCEKMIAACFLNTQQLGTWEEMLHRKATDIKRFTEICTDNTQVHVSSSVNLKSWIPLHKRRAIEEENRRVDMVRRPDVEWQNFDIALSIPEPSYSDEQRWLFRIDDYSTSDINAWATTETFFCERCEQEKSASVFCRDSTSFASGPQFPDQCMGCAYKNALYNSFYRIKDYREMRDSETYALARARYLYVQKFQEAKPGDDLLEYIKKCCPLVYMSVGKVVSSYGGLRCPIATSVAYASWGKARQLAWDRAYDAQNNLRFIAYYDAGNAAYAGFMKTLLTPQERERLFRGSENPAEELLGDVFELALGLLFKAWGSPQDIDACIYGTA
ncbi:unnamed protein product, partial [Symbiodinium sp. CCMP2456]